MPPSFQIEKSLGAPKKLIGGVDEVGRGALAGNVLAAALILKSDTIPKGIDDSKKLSPKTRTQLFHTLQTIAHIGIGQARPSEIDQIGIAKASLLAMRRAITNLPVTPHHLIIDGPHLPDLLPCPARAIIHGDSLALSIAAASIIAKVTRDTIMQTLARQYPEYGWQSNVGYGTAHHRNAIRKYGRTPLHRQSFKTI